ncbi:MAG: hypothetical protein ACI4HO_09105 [Ruminococcus sp.]
MESKTTLLLSAVKAVLSEYCPEASFWRSITGKYPRAEYEIKKIQSDIVDKYILTVNLYEKNDLSEITKIADKLDDEVSMATFETDLFYFKFINNNDRQIINDNDSAIGRVMFTYQILLYWRDNLNE